MMTAAELLAKYKEGDRLFVGANLRSAYLRGANLQGANLRSANLQGANLQDADLRSANLRGADLQDADLQRAYLRGADLQRANLQAADLRSAYLRGADLQRANLRSAYLRGAHLQRAYLQRANLQGADLQAAHLQGANLQNANLQNANLRGANLGDQWIIQGATRSDGYQFILSNFRGEGVRLCAGCRNFDMPTAYQHWITTREGTKLGNETIEILDSLWALAFQRGYLTSTGEWVDEHAQADDAQRLSPDRWDEINRETIELAKIGSDWIRP